LGTPERQSLCESHRQRRWLTYWSYRKVVQNVVLAFLFNGLGIPAAATGVVYPIWGMVAMAASVTTIFINSLWGRGSYFFQALQTVGHPPQSPARVPTEARPGGLPLPASGPHVALDEHPTHGRRDIC
jgi:hypothetical protein